MCFELGVGYFTNVEEVIVGDTALANAFRSGIPTRIFGSVTPNRATAIAAGDIRLPEREMPGVTVLAVATGAFGSNVITMPGITTDACAGDATPNPTIEVSTPATSAVALAGCARIVVEAVLKSVGTGREPTATPGTTGITVELTGASPAATAFTAGDVIVTLMTGVVTDATAADGTAFGEIPKPAAGNPAADAKPGTTCT